MGVKKEKENLKEFVERRSLEKNERFIRLAGIKTLVCCTENTNLF
jgi:hypothetical protein